MQIDLEKQSLDKHVAYKPYVHCDVTSHMFTARNGRRPAFDSPLPAGKEMVMAGPAQATCEWLAHCSPLIPKASPLERKTRPCPPRALKANMLRTPRKVGTLGALAQNTQTCHANDSSGQPATCVNWHNPPTCHTGPATWEPELWRLQHTSAFNPIPQIPWTAWVSDSSESDRRIFHVLEPRSTISHNALRVVVPETTPAMTDVSRLLT